MHKHLPSNYGAGDGAPGASVFRPNEAQLAEMLGLLKVGAAQAHTAYKHAWVPLRLRPTRG